VITRDEWGITPDAGLRDEERDRIIKAYHRDTLKVPSLELLMAIPISLVSFSS